MRHWRKSILLLLIIINLQVKYLKPKKEKWLVDKSDFSTIKAELKTEQEKKVKIQAFESSLFFWQKSFWGW